MGRTSSRLIYAWIGAKDGDKFDIDTADEATVSVTAKKEQTQIDVGSTINMHADTAYTASANRYAANEGAKVDLGAVDEVTFTAQLQDEDGADVKRAGIAVRVEYLQGSEGTGTGNAGDDGVNPRDLRNFANTHAAEGVTDDNGQFSFTVQGPADDRRVSDQIRADDILFIVDGLEDGPGSILWVEEDPVLTSTTVESPTYVLAGASSGVRTTVYLWDQYGNPHQSHRSQKAEITIGDNTVADNSSIRQVISRGYASWRHVLTAAANVPVPVEYDVRMLLRNSSGVAVQATADPDANGQVGGTAVDDLNTTYNDGRVITSDGTTVVHDTTTSNALTRPGTGQEYTNILNTSAHDLFDSRESDRTVDGTDSVQVVDRAVSTNVGNDVMIIIAALVDDDEFLADTTSGGDNNAELVYSYDSDDIFIDSTGSEGVEITMASFEGKIGRATNPVTPIQVIAYDVDGTSIFRLVSSG